MKSIVIIGYGALGKILSSAIVSHLDRDYVLVGIYDIAVKESIVEVEGQAIPAFHSFDEVLVSEADIVVEIAGVQAVRECVKPLLEAGKDVVVTSVGALADARLRETIAEIARAQGRKVHITSGAVGGFDILSTVALMGGAEVSIQSTKKPKSLNGAPYLKGRDLPEDERVVAFSGSAAEAIAGFPKNTNVAVATGLAGGGVDQVKVEVVSDPAAQGNTHRITIENDRARAEIEVTAKTDPRNPKSSVTAAWSVAALLANLANPLQLF